MTDLFDLGADFDWEEVETPEYVNVPPGLYEAQVVDIAPYEGNNGKTSLTFDYLITDDPEHDGQFVGKTVRELKNYDKSNPDSKKNGLSWIKLRLVSLGMPVDYKGGFPEKDMFVGKDVVLTLKQDKTGQYVNVAKVELLESEPESAVVYNDGDTQAADAKQAEDNPFAGL